MTGIVNKSHDSMKTENNKNPNKIEYDLLFWRMHIVIKTPISHFRQKNNRQIEHEKIDMPHMIF